MNIQGKIEVAKMRSLIERMEKPRSFHKAMLNEAKRIVEATGAKRVQISRDQLIDMLNQADDSKANNGLFASVTYVTYKEPYKTKKNWRPDDVTNALNAHTDMSDKDWHQKLTSFNSPDAKGKNPVSTVVVTQRYLIHWSSQDHFKKKYGEYADALHNLRMRHGIGLQSDGMLGDNTNQRQMSDVGMQFNQTGKLSRDFNTAGADVKVTAYLVDEQGHITDELPGDVLKSMTKLPQPPKPEKEASEKLSGEVLDAYMKAKAELDKTFKAQNFLFDKILCIAANIDGVSYYYINDQLKSPISKGSEINVDPQEMLKIAEEQLGESFDVIQGFSQGTSIQIP